MIPPQLFITTAVLLFLTLAFLADNRVFSNSKHSFRQRRLQSDDHGIEEENFLKVDNLHDALMLVKGRCVKLRSNDISGVRQWGNYMIDYYTALMFIVQAGASSIKMPRQEVLGLDHIRGTTYHPLDSADALALPSDECIVWHPILTYFFATTKNGSMQDLYDFRGQWDKIMGIEQPNPFVADFGIQPAMKIASQRMDIPWKDVIVLHMRGGDAQAVAYRGEFMGHMQPPCSYYEDIVETGYDNGTAFPYVLVITERKKKMQPEAINPCAAYIENRYRSGLHATKLVNYNELAQHLSNKADDDEHIGQRKDMFILSNAVNLGEGHSSFTMGTNLLNHQLKRHFVPSAPATINSFLQMKTSSDGTRIEYLRQYYSENVTQVQYLMPGWLDYNASCSALEAGWHRWAGKMLEVYKQHQSNHKTISNLMLEYPRSNLVKFVTSNEPFRCNGVELNPHWYAPCMCDDFSEIA